MDIAAMQKSMHVKKALLPNWTAHGLPSAHCKGLDDVNLGQISGALKLALACK